MARAVMKLGGLLLAAIVPVGCSDEISDLTVCDASLLNKNQQVVFAEADWKEGDPAKRGQMVMDLAQRHHLVDVTPAVVRGLLGPNTCYVNYDDEPCYELSLAGRRQYLAFPVAHSGPKQGKYGHPICVQTPQA